MYPVQFEKIFIFFQTLKDLGPQSENDLKYSALDFHTSPPRVEKCYKTVVIGAKEVYTEIDWLKTKALKQTKEDQEVYRAMQFKEFENVMKYFYFKI